MLQKLTSGTPVINRETTRLTKSGDRISVSTTLSPIHDADGVLIGAARIIRDISNQKRAEEALSNISRKLIEAQEQERVRIARELHDDVGQRLALLTNKLAALADAATDSVQHRSEIIELQDQLSAVSTDIQTLSHTLHSSKIDILGVTAGTRLFCREFAEHQNVQVNLETHDVPRRLPPNISLCLFRLLQEALHNAAKHSGAKEFTVRLFGTADEIQLIVSDRGCGFDVRAAHARGGIGLVSMAERVRLVGGTLSIESNPSRGTSVHARVPLAAPASSN